MGGLRWLMGLAVVAGVALAAIGAPPPKSAPTLRPGKPADHGLRDADLDALRAIMQKAVDKKTVPGVSLLLAHKGEVIFKEAYGDLAVDKPVKLASDSKPVSATVVMAVVDQGKMRLDDPITKFIPEFAGTKAAKATVRQLLSHTAGIRDKFDSGGPSGVTLADFARHVAEKGTLEAPGKYSYSSMGIDLACRCAEKAASKPFEELMKQHLLEPLGMKDTGFEWGADPESVPEDAKARGEGRYVSGGGGLSATLDDMAAFYQMHLNGGRYGDKQILSAKAVAEMHKKQASPPRGGGYGLGFTVIGPFQGGVSRSFLHGGAFGTMCWADADRQLVGIYFSQAGPKTGPVLIAVQKKTLELFPAGR
jgi:CubicO group peptidase (beta-lactamase class C family)